MSVITTDILIEGHPRDEVLTWLGNPANHGKILNGDYRRRSDATTPPLSSDIEDAVGYYGEQARGAMDSLNGVLDRARDAFSSAFKGSSGT